MDSSEEGANLGEKKDLDEEVDLDEEETSDGAGVLTELAILKWDDKK